MSKWDFGEMSAGNVDIKLRIVILVTCAELAIKDANIVYRGNATI